MSTLSGMILVPRFGYTVKQHAWPKNSEETDFSLCFETNKRWMDNEWPMHLHYCLDCLSCCSILVLSPNTQKALQLTLSSAISAKHVSRKDPIVVVVVGDRNSRLLPYPLLKMLFPENHIPSTQRNLILDRDNPGPCVRVDGAPMVPGACSLSTVTNL